MLLPSPCAYVAPVGHLSCCKASARFFLSHTLFRCSRRQARRRLTTWLISSKLRRTRSRTWRGRSQHFKGIPEAEAAGECHPYASPPFIEVQMCGILSVIVPHYVPAPVSVPPSSYFTGLGLRPRQPFKNSEMRTSELSCSWYRSRWSWPRSARTR